MTGCTDAKATRDRTTWNHPGLDVCTSWLVDWLFGRLRLQIPIISWKQLLLKILFILYEPSLVGMICLTPLSPLWYHFHNQPLLIISPQNNAQCPRCQIGFSCSKNLPCSNYRRIICSWSYCMEHPKILIYLATTRTNYPSIATTRICSR